MATGAPWMAAQEAVHGEATAGGGTVLLQSRKGIQRTGGLKAA
jgi:hypothetical protein